MAQICLRTEKDLENLQVNFETTNSGALKMHISRTPQLLQKYTYLHGHIAILDISINSNLPPVLHRLKLWLIMCQIFASDGAHVNAFAGDDSLRISL